jgi:excisionase family DNA binding protein
MTHQQTRRSFLIDDAAEILGVSRRTVYYRIRQGRLATVRTRGGSQRVLLSSIERLLRLEHGLPPLEAPQGADSEPEPPPFQIQAFP